MHIPQKIFVFNVARDSAITKPINSATPIIVANNPTVYPQSSFEPASPRFGSHRNESSCFYFGETEETCVMCVYEFRELEIIRVLPCGHVFHRDVS